MGMFNFFGESEHKVFDYKPIYYDKEKEELKRRFGAVDGSLGRKDNNEGGEKDAYVPGSYIKGSMRDGAYQRTKSHTNKVQTIIGIITALLIFMVLFMIAKFYTML